MTVLELLKGRKVRLVTDARVPVELEIESVELENHSEDLEPSTAKNDWWPAQRQWKTFSVKFTNGYTKTYSSIDDIVIVG